MTPTGNLLTIESLAELASAQQSPCLSLYQPTHRSRPENQQDPIRFRNLIKELEASLRQKYPAVETRLLLEPFAGSWSKRWATRFWPFRPIRCRGERDWLPPTGIEPTRTNHNTKENGMQIRSKCIPTVTGLDHDNANLNR